MYIGTFLFKNYNNCLGENIYYKASENIIVSWMLHFSLLLSSCCLSLNFFASFLFILADKQESQIPLLGEK